MIKVGHYYGEGFELGMDDQEKAIEKSSHNLAQTALDAMDLSAISSRLRDVMSLNSGRISQAITGQALNPQYYFADEKGIDYEILAQKLKLQCPGCNLIVTRGRRTNHEETIREVMDGMNENVINTRRSKGYARI